MPYTRMAALTLATATLAVAGCGGSASMSNQSSNGATTQGNVSNAASTQPLTRAELIAQGDAICRRLNMRAATVRTTTLHSVGTTAPSLASYYVDALAELSKLTPPAEMTATWHTMISDVRRAPAEITTMGRFALDNDAASAVKAELRLKKIQEHRFAIARRNGFTYCGEV